MKMKFIFSNNFVIKSQKLLGWCYTAVVSLPLVKRLVVPFRVVLFGVLTPGPEPLPLLEASLEPSDSSTL
jgi:hypothetical protein